MTNFTRRTVLAFGAALAALPVTGFAASVPKPDAGMGMVVFYRGGASVGQSMRFDIVDANGDVVAKMGHNAVEPVMVTPGAHEFSVPDANAVSGVIEVQAGQTVFVESYFDPGTNAGKLQFRIQSEEQAMKRISKM